MRFVFALGLICLAACTEASSTTEDTSPGPTVRASEPAEPAIAPQQHDISEEAGTEVRGSDLAGASEVQLWSTLYYLFEANAVTGTDAVPLRGMNDAVIGPALTANSWCAAAIEGSVRVDGTVYNFAGTRDPRQASCPHEPSERVRWKKTDHPFGTGSKSNPLVPMRSLACDLGTVSASKPWLNGGFAAFGQRIYIPDADGVELPDGTRHDGIFRCDDIGGKINGNHIDLFLGPAAGLGDALARNPFSFVHSSSNRTFKAFVLP